MKYKFTNFEKWKFINQGRHFGLFDYISCMLQIDPIDYHPDLIYAMMKLVWPEFIEVEGKVFLKENFNKNLYIDEYQNDPEAECWINIVSTELLFDTEEAATGFAYELRNSWVAKLQLEHPDKKFDVLVFTGDDIGITFFQVDSGPKIDSNNSLPTPNMKLFNRYSSADDVERIHLSFRRPTDLEIPK